MSSLSTKLLSSKIDVLKNKIIDTCIVKGIDSGQIIPPEGAENPHHYPLITSSLFNLDQASTINPSVNNTRFKQEFRFYKSSPKNVDGALWNLQSNRDFLACDVGTYFYASLMPEVYGADGYEIYYSSDYFVDRSYDRTSHKDKQENVLSLVTEHQSLIEVAGTGSIIYTNFGRQFEDLDTEHFNKTMLMAYPYSSSLTLHEMFKSLLEWQWAYNELGATEHMATLANGFLSVLGMSYLNESTDEVVGALMSLPDQPLAQYIKTGTCWVNEEEPNCPEEFTKWCKDIMELITLAYDYKAVSSRL